MDQKEKLLIEEVLEKRAFKGKIWGRDAIADALATVASQLFRKAYEKRDPILLAQSPFGFYWQILGAWDKEMLLLGEL